VLLLAFDTSTPAVTVAVCTVDRAPVVDGGWFRSPADGIATLASCVEVATNRHGELLAPLINAALNDAGVKAADLDAIAVGLGPGPFTGLRVGIVTAKSMADALSIPVYAESSLAIVAAAPTQPRHGGVATDARRKQVYWAIYDGFRCVAGPDIARPEVAAERFAAAGVRRVFGEGPVLYPEAFAAFAHDADDTYPAAETLAMLVRDRLLDVAPSDDLSPMYLRRPDAQPPGPPKQVTPA
jgi:tRNA threonylcarbamoyl adenosine modification protein YeaZ